MNTPLRVAVVGAGRMGADHIERIHRRINGAEIAAVVDIDRARAEAAIAHIPGAVAHTDFQEVLDRDDIDAALIATPGFLHEQVLLSAIEHGLPTLCEKPLTPDAESSWRVVEAEAGCGSGPATPRTQGGTDLVDWPPLSLVCARHVPDPARRGALRPNPERRMRLSTAQIHNQGLQGMLQKQQAMAKTQQQMTTGSKLVTAADDPSALADRCRPYYERLWAHRIAPDRGPNRAGAGGVSLRQCGMRSDE